MKALVAVSILLFSVSAQADEFVGLLLGPSIVNKGVGLRLNFGFETAGKLDPHWSLGFLVNFESLGTAISATTDSATLTLFVGGITYHGWENNRGPWIGVRAGLGVLNNVNSVGGDGSVGGSSNEAAFGAAAGYDQELGFLGKEWTWGPQGQALMVNTASGYLQVFNILLAIRYWPE